MMDKPILDLASLLHPVPLDVFFFELLGKKLAVGAAR